MRSFYADDICSEHIKCVSDLKSEREDVEFSIIRERNIWIEEDPDIQVKLELGKAIKTFSRGEEIEVQILSLIDRLPAIKILPEDKPGNRLKSNYIGQCAGYEEWGMTETIDASEWSITEWNEA
ncbi:hypothetical protein ABKA04_004083 [Annulohypoxylon sp. FPYF3050]